MGNITLDAYLFFKGNCREAMEFYQGIFGGELTTQTYGEVGATSDEDRKNHLMHARLEGGDITLMASDTPEASPRAAKVSLTLSGEDEDKLRTIFDQLSSGGEVTSQLKKEFWGDIFGTFIDRYGIDWMVNITTKKQ